MKIFIKPSLIMSALLLTLFVGTSSLFAYQSAAVYAENEDISYDLDLNAVASIFGESRDLADFEWRLNDPNLQVSNLDLNGDYRVDYLRVIETTRYGLHLIVIQAVVGPDMYQDVATIEVFRDNYSRPYVQIVGDPYLYGYNYIIEPYYVYRPAIYSYFWGAGHYRPYYSHYRWGYYPRHYRAWRPIPVPYYRKHVHRVIDRRHRYHYTTVRRNTKARKLHRQIRRDDYARRHPNRSFVNRQQHMTKQGAKRHAHKQWTYNRNSQIHKRVDQQAKRYQKHDHLYKSRYQSTSRQPNQRKNQMHSRQNRRNQSEVHQQQRVHIRHNTTDRSKASNRHASSGHYSRQSYQGHERYQNRQAIQAKSLAKTGSVRHRERGRGDHVHRARNRQAVSAQKHTAKSHPGSSSRHSATVRTGNGERH